LRFSQPHLQKHRPFSQARRTAAALTGAAMLGLLVGAAPQGFAQAQQTPIPEEPSTQPQIEIAGTGVATLDLGRSPNALSGGGKASSSQINISDSALMLGAAQRLYHGAIGSFSLGGLTLDQSNTGNGTQLFLHQAYVDYQSRSFETYLGRTDQPTAQIVQFPTLRGDDLISFTNILNPFSNGENVEEHRYSNVAAITLNRGLSTFANFHVQHLINTAGQAGDTGLNSYGASIQHLSPPTLEAIQKVVSYGAGYEYRSVGRSEGGSSQALYAGGVINLKPSLNNLVDLRVLDNYTFGNNTKTFGNTSDTFRANSNAVAVAVRYLHSPFGMPSSQLSLTMGYKSYDKVSNANSYGAALTGVKRLGQGVDAVAQYVYQRRDGALANAYGGAREENAVQVGLIFNFDATFNRSIGPRRSLLNLNHQYIPD
jgi:hypothetical protein